ncbi:hypothetical protein J1N35_040860 [Gossypium stocksii]|uniref:Uncharacterized protein n=1 Tax=Gossypium stocksii TaxID=47602 RepID=A0A9D3ZIR6_9ROSI|nr:hypothetical protein J1N35_040860 [Gossypium stocksii]
MAPILASSTGAGHSPCVATIREPGWWSPRGALASHGGRGGSAGLGGLGGPDGDYDTQGPHAMPIMASPMANQIGLHGVGPNNLGYGTYRSHHIGHVVGPYSRLLGEDPSAGQHNEPNANLVGFQATVPTSIQNCGVP